MYSLIYVLNVADALKLTFLIWYHVVTAMDTWHVFFGKLLDFEMLKPFPLPAYSELALKSRAQMRLGSQNI